MDFKDYYSTLGVTKTASDKEIKGAFRKLARKYHPDVNPGDKASEAKFKEINEANEVLGDPEKRKKYDELGANWRMYENAHPGGAPGGGNPFAGFGGGAGGYRTMSQEDVEQMFGGGGGFSDFFATFFGGGGGGFGGFEGAPGRGQRARAGQRQGRDVEHEIELSLEDAYHGVTRRLALRNGGQARSVDVRIPAGVTDGSRVRIAGEGEPGAGGAASGDLFLRVRLLPHTVFERKGRDLYVKVPIYVTTAVLGGEAEVPTLTSKTARLKIPAATQNGQLFRLKGYGMPAVGKGDDKGDVYARIDVQLPASVTPEEREHWEALAKTS